jgi:hypothetical protein
VLFRLQTPRAKPAKVENATLDVAS